MIVEIKEFIINQPIWFYFIGVSASFFIFFIFNRIVKEIEPTSILSAIFYSFLSWVMVIIQFIIIFVEIIRRRNELILRLENNDLYRKLNDVFKNER